MSSLADTPSHGSPMDDALLQAALLEQSFNQLRVGVIGTVVSATAMGVGLVSLGNVQSLELWAAFQVLCSCGALAILVARHHGLLRGRTLATLARRTAAFLGGAGWGLAAFLWPIHSGRPEATMVAFCLAGVASGSASTMAPDPVSFLVLLMAAFIPACFGLWGEWWHLLAVGGFAIGNLALTLRNRATLKDSLRLRFENTQLLKRALSDAADAKTARQRAELSMAQKTRFLAAASHDLRQPVQALSLFSEVLVRDPPIPSPVKREAADAVKRSTDALSEMLERLLDLSRFDSELVLASPRALRLRPLLQDLTAGLAVEAEQNGCVISSAGPDLHVYADPVLLSRVVQNLCINAIRHSRTDRVLLSLRRREGQCAIQVWDQGAGVAHAERERIFEEFVQLANKARERERGLGMGLALVRRICSLNRWDLTLHSEVGRGSVFSVVVPLTTAEAQEPIIAAAYRPLGLRVLLVEDDPLARDAATQWLTGLECHVISASNGTDALRILDGADRVDLVVTDHGLPGQLTGVDVVERLNRRTPVVPAIMLSGDITFPTSADLARIRGPLGTPVLAKPVHGKELWSTIQRVLAAADALSNRDP